MKLVIALVSVVLFEALAIGQTAGSGGQPQFTPTGPELERRDRPVTPDDLRILAEAADLLKDESVWNRADDRDCKDDEATGKRSLFCALEKACIDVLGTYDHRRVALQEVRFAVEDATRGQDFDHRLRDFNNLPTTRLADVKAVLRVATERVRSRLRRSSSPTSVRCTFECDDSAFTPANRTNPWLLSSSRKACVYAHVRAVDHPCRGRRLDDC